MTKAALHNSSYELTNALGAPFKMPFFRNLCIFFLVAPVLAALVFAAIYFSCCLYGLATGQYYPARELFQIFPAFAPAFQEPELIAKSMLFYAAAGFCLCRFLRRAQEHSVENRIPALLVKYWAIWSLPIVFSLLPATLGYVYFAYSPSSGEALAGIIPYSDAYNHYYGYTTFFYDGFMNDWVLRRPLAAFFGTVMHWLAGNESSMAITLRCLLAGVAMWASCAVVNRLFGVWSAICCLALEYYYIHRYLNLFLSESLGFFWGCLAVALWLQAVRHTEASWLAAAFGATALGLLTRMGAMFLVPIMFLYGLWLWRKTHPGRKWLRMPLIVLCLVGLGVVLLNTVCSHTGKGGTQETGSNFSQTFVGLTLGTNYTGAYKTYGEEIKTQKLKGEKEKSRFLYKQGIKNILQSPGVFFGRLLEGEIEFLKNMDFFLFHNWYLLAICACLLAARRKSIFNRKFAVFWGCVWLAILLSIPFIYFDDSWRVNIFVYPFIACFFSLVLADPSPSLSEDSDLKTYGALCAVSLTIIVPLLMAGIALFPHFFTSSRIESILAYVKEHPRLPQNQFYVSPDGVGFLVLPDTETPDPKLPAMTWTDFKKRYEKFAGASNEPFFEALPKPPFYMLQQPPIAPNHYYNYLIAPPEVIEDRSALLWHFFTEPAMKDEITRIYWNIVTKADRVMSKE